jgi:hypothetical protein
MKNKFLLLNILILFFSTILSFLITYILDLPLLTPVLIFTLFSYLSFCFKNNKKIYLHLGLLLVIVIVATKAIVDYSSISYYFIPVAAIGMLTVVLFENLELGLVMIISSSLLSGLIAKNNFSLGLILFIGGIVGILSIWRARRRSKIIWAGLYIGIVQLFCILLISFQNSLFKFNDIFRTYAAPIISSGIVASFIVIGSLPIFEYLFKVVTNISLLELSDFNHPLLRKMILEAPGTYQHSLLVGNLAEAAAEVIGANSLLARVGAYYHDIGKIEKAEYFSENQMHIRSKHDKLQPSMSRLIITSHIKEGVELAQRYKLNPVIIEFIQQHHGTSMIYYFYRRAMEDAELDEKVQEEGFRYPGPKPQRKEIAIVLLADAVEAACRSLLEPTHERIKELVRKIINNKFIDGQLDECDLTLRDIEMISSVFSRILSAIYHSRVRYPEENNGVKHSKSSKKIFNIRKEDKKENKASFSSAE